MERPNKVILDYDGTLTAEEEMVGELAQRSPGLDGRRIEPSRGNRLEIPCVPSWCRKFAKTTLKVRLYRVYPADGEAD